MLREIQQQRGFILPTLIAFMMILGVLGAVVLQVATQSNVLSVRQLYIQQAQLASAAGMDFAKEQYELDIDYVGTAETDLATTERYRVTYEIQHIRVEET